MKLNNTTRKTRFDKSLLYINENAVLQSTYEKNIEKINSVINDKNFRNSFELATKEWQHPINKVKQQLDSTLAELKLKRKELHLQWEITYEGLSWWYKMKYEDGPDFSELDHEIRRVETLLSRFQTQYGEEQRKVKSHFSLLQNRSSSRLKISQEYLINYQKEKFDKSRLSINDKPERLLEMATWGGILGLSASILEDFSTSHNVYDVLRSVNGNFEIA